MTEPGEFNVDPRLEEHEPDCVCVCVCVCVCDEVPDRWSAECVAGGSSFITVVVLR